MFTMVLLTMALQTNEQRLQPKVHFEIASMTYALTRYKDYQDYLDNCDLGEGNHRLLSTGEVIELPPEEDDNPRFALRLYQRIFQIPGFADLARVNTTEIQVHPLGDKRVSRRPDLVVLRPEHIEYFAQTNHGSIQFGMPAPLFVAELVSAGNENSDNYQRDYAWKREQYQWWEIPEYWIIDRHRGKVTVLTLVDGVYAEQVYTGNVQIASAVFPSMKIVPQDLLSNVIL